GDALQLARGELGADPVLLPHHADRDRALGGHGSVSTRGEALFDLVDLADQVVDALRDVAAKLVARAHRGFELGHALLALEQRARQTVVLPAEILVARGQLEHEPFETLEVRRRVTLVVVAANPGSPDRGGDRTEGRGRASSDLWGAVGPVIRRKRHATGASNAAPGTRPRPRPPLGLPRAPSPPATGPAGSPRRRTRRARWSRSCACRRRRCRADRAAGRGPRP